MAFFTHMKGSFVIPSERSGQPKAVFAAKRDLDFAGKFLEGRSLSITRRAYT